MARSQAPPGVNVGRGNPTLKGSNPKDEAALTAGSTLSGLELALSGPSRDSKHFKTADPLCRAARTCGTCSPRTRGGLQGVRSRYSLHTSLLSARGEVSFVPRASRRARVRERRRGRFSGGRRMPKMKMAPLPSLDKEGQAAAGGCCRGWLEAAETLLARDLQPPPLGRGPASPPHRGGELFSEQRPRSRKRRSLRLFLAD